MIYKIQAQPELQNDSDRTLKTHTQRDFNIVFTGTRKYCFQLLLGSLLEYFFRLSFPKTHIPHEKETSSNI